MSSYLIQSSDVLVNVGNGNLGVNFKRIDRLIISMISYIVQGTLGNMVNVDFNELECLV